MKLIDVGTLQDWLAHGKDVTVVDVRTDTDYAEWSIPGSIHINAYDALKAQSPGALADLDVPSAVPVVNVWCRQSEYDGCPTDEASFVTSLLGTLGATLPHTMVIVGHNEHGTLPTGDAAELEAGANRCVVG